MASFNVSENFGTFIAKQGFRVEPNKAYIPPVLPYSPGRFGSAGKQRSMRLFAPEALKGKAAKKWFNKVFWACHDRKDRGCLCCTFVLSTFIRV